VTGPEKQFGEMETQQLLQRAREGEAEAFCALAQAHEPRLFQQALALCHNPATAKDLAADTLIEAWKSIRGQPELARGRRARRLRAGGTGNALDRLPRVPDEARPVLHGRLGVALPRSGQRNKAVGQAWRLFFPGVSFTSDPAESSSFLFFSPDRLRDHPSRFCHCGGDPAWRVEWHSHGFSPGSQGW